jgi:LacI family transcriptional regulator
MCISNESMDKEAHTLEMLSNGTIDGFSVSEAQKLGESFSKLLMMVLL